MNNLPKIKRILLVASLAIGSAVGLMAAQSPTPAPASTSASPAPAHDHAAMSQTAMPAPAASTAPKPAADEPKDAASGWALANKAVTDASAKITAGDLAAVHPLMEQVMTGLKAMQAHSDMVLGDKHTRLTAALTQALTQADAVHDAADEKDKAKTAAQLKILQGALKLIQAQYPADTLAPPGKPATDAKAAAPSQPSAPASASGTQK